MWCNYDDVLCFSLFQVVNFPNSECTGTNGDKGTCLSRSECQGRSGSISGENLSLDQEARIISQEPVHSGLVRVVWFIRTLAGERCLTIAHTSGTPDLKVSRFVTWMIQESWIHRILQHCQHLLLDVPQDQLWRVYGPAGVWGADHGGADHPGRVLHRLLPGDRGGHGDNTGQHWQPVPEDMRRQHRWPGTWSV